MNVDRDLYEPLAQLASALGHPIRLRALHLLFQGERSIEELASLLDVSFANTAAHMKVLRGVGLVTAERRGKHLIQQVSGEAPLALFLSLRKAGEECLHSVRALDAACDEDGLLSALSPRECGRKLQESGVILTDLRPAAEYRAGHLPRARSLPFAELEARLHELPKRPLYLVYCRGKYCPNARRGAAALRRAGFRTQRLGFGVPEWRASGLPLHTESKS